MVSLVQIPLVLAITLLAFFGWLLTTVAGGGGPLLLVPAVSFLLGAEAVAPVVTIAALVGAPARAGLFWKAIDWRIVGWYLPGAVPGALLGAYVFAITESGWLRIIVGLFLISTMLQFRFGESRGWLRMPTPGFLPVGFGLSVLSGLIGGVGPLLNPFYLGHGTEKEAMIGTKAVNASVMHASKLGAYVGLGAFAWKYLLYGLCAGIAAILAAWLGKRVLGRMPVGLFRRLVVSVMVAAGGLMIWSERALLRGLWD